MLKYKEIIETERLVLRKPSLEDAEVVHSFMKNPNLAKYMCWTVHTSVEQTKELLQKQIKDIESSDNWFKWLIVRKDNEKVIGSINARVIRHMVDLTYLLAEEEWYNGFMSEAVEEVIKFAFSDESIYRVSASCDRENTASINLLEKVGMTREGILRKYIVLPNISDNLVIYIVIQLYGNFVIVKEKKRWK